MEEQEGGRFRPFQGRSGGGGSSADAAFTGDAGTAGSAAPVDDETIMARLRGVLSAPLRIKARNIPGGQFRLEDIEALLLNLGVVSALLGGIIISLMALQTPELYNHGDLFMLSYTNNGFVAKFAPLAGLTKIPSAVEEADQLPGVDYTQPFFAACQGTLQQEKIDAKAYTHADRDVTTQRFVPGALDRGGCNLHNLLASEELFHWMKSEGQLQARLWIMEGLHKKAFNSEWALSSRAVTYYGFQAVIALLISLFLSFYLYMSLNLSNLRGDSVKLSRWWMPFGLTLSVFGYLAVIFAGVMLVETLDAVMTLRLPYMSLIGEWYLMVDQPFDLYICIVVPLIMTAHFIYCAGWLDPGLKYIPGLHHVVPGLEKPDDYQPIPDKKNDDP